MNKLPKKRRDKIKEEGRTLVEIELTLQELRKSLKISQTEMAERLGLNQGDVSKFERREDVFVSSVRKYIKAMGGE